MKSSFERLISLFTVVCVLLSGMLFAIGVNAAETLSMTVESKNVTASGTDVVYSTDGTDKSYQLIISGLSTENGDTFYELEIAAVLYIKTSVG